MPVNIDGTPHVPRLGDGTECNVYEYDGSSWVAIYAFGTTVGLPVPNNSNSDSGENGLLTVVNAEIAGFRATIATGDFAPSGLQYAVARDGSGNAVSPQVDISNLGPGDTFDVEFDSPRTNDTALLAGNSNSHTRSRYEESSQYPYSGDEIDVSAGVYSSGISTSSSVLYNFESIRPILP